MNSEFDYGVGCRNRCVEDWKEFGKLFTALGNHLRQVLWLYDVV